MCTGLNRVAELILIRVPTTKGCEDNQLNPDF